jgi:hypothetical protein
MENIIDLQKLTNISREYHLLKGAIEDIGITSESSEYLRLKEVNLKLWHIEDKIRIKEAKNEFDSGFIELARSVYYKNDIRAAIKKEINLKYHSQLIEEKEYVKYR